MFYDGELTFAGDRLLVDSLLSWEELPNPHNCPVLFYGVEGKDCQEGNSPSFFNPLEATVILKLITSLLQFKRYKIKAKDIGLITPYKKQVEKCRKLLVKEGLEEIKVASVEEFQGQERTAIFISTVRSSENFLKFDALHQLGFLNNEKRFNVALTRAQALMVIVGNPYLLCKDKGWLQLIEFCLENNAYTGCDKQSLLETIETEKANPNRLQEQHLQEYNVNFTAPGAEYEDNL